MSTQEYEFETEFEYEGEYENEWENEGEFEWEGEYEEEYESEWEGEYEEEGELGETLEYELAAELMEINSEAELEEFLGKLVRRIGKGAVGFIKSPAGRALGGILKNVAKKALPVVGGALGSMVAPGIGTAIGSKLGGMAAGLFELEYEGMSNDEVQLEMARRYVQFANAAIRQGARAPMRAQPQAIARAATIRAARRYMPGLVRRGPYTYPALRPRPTAGSPYRPAPRGYIRPAPPAWGGGALTGTHTGRWVRRGNKVVLYGV